VEDCQEDGVTILRTGGMYNPRGGTTGKQDKSEDESLASTAHTGHEFRRRLCDTLWETNIENYRKRLSMPLLSDLT